MPAKIDSRVNNRQFEVLAKAQSAGPVRLTKVKAAEGLQVL